MHVLAANATPTVKSVSIWIAFGILIVGVVVAWYLRHLVQTIADVRAAKARLAGARRARFGAWKVMLPVAFVVIIAADVWIRHKG